MTLGRCVLFSAVLCVAAPGQCAFDWQAGPPASGPLGLVEALFELPNGDLVAGGSFAAAGAAAASGLARFDGLVWSEFHGGVDGEVHTIIQLAGGDLVIGGSFTSVGGVQASGVARFDGTQWSPLGAGLAADVRALLPLQNGDVVAQVGFNALFVFDGQAWSGLGHPAGTPFSGAVFSMTEAVNGDLIVGGSMSSIPGGVPTSGLARFDGVTWSPMQGLGATGGSVLPVLRVQALPNGDLAACSGFNQQVFGIDSGAGFVLQPVPFKILEMAVSSTGDLLAAGVTNPSSQAAQLPVVGRHVAGTWSVVGGLDVQPAAFLERANGDLLVAGGGGEQGPSVVSYDGSGWNSVGALRPAGFFGQTLGMANGDLVIGGSFAEIDGVAAENVAVWNGSTWSALGQGVDGRVTALAEAPDGSLIVGGYFATAGGSPASRIARWSGGSWSTLGSGLPTPPGSIAVNEHGQVMVEFSGIAPVSPQHFDGQSWTIQVLPGALFVTDLVAAPDGDFLFSGLFGGPVPGQSSSIARWSAGSVTLSGPQQAQGLVLTAAAGGDVYGAFWSLVPGGGRSLYRLSGSTWQQIGGFDGSLEKLEALPGGDLLGVSVPLGTTTAVLRRYRGGTWDELQGINTSNVVDVAISGRGELLVAANATLSNGGVGVGFVRGVPTCPADAVTVGAGCVGSSGPLSLAIDALPWLGATMRTTATGLPAQSLALHVIGVATPSQPLPLSAPGCTLLVTPAALELLLPESGQVETAVVLPNDPALTSVSFSSQVLGLELSSIGGLGQTTSTNALLLTVGAL